MVMKSYDYEAEAVICARRAGEAPSHAAGAIATLALTYATLAAYALAVEQEQRQTGEGETLVTAHEARRSVA
jgi:hypothetical protein